MNVIYGAGEYGRLLYNFFANKGISIDFFVQTQLNEKSKQFCGIPVISKIDLLRMEVENLNVYIGICDRTESIKIKQSLIDEGNDLMEILECGEFIKDNLTDEQIGKVVYTGNNYEKELSRDYWNGLSEDIEKIEHLKNNLLKGLPNDSKKLVKHVIDRMISFPNVGDDIFTIEEKKCIRKYEREFVHRVRVEEIGERKWKEWRGYRIPYEVYMEPTVFYYDCGICAIKNIEQIRRGDIIDAGAYVGDSSIVLSKYTDGVVHAFEAFYDSYCQINEICTMNYVHNVKGYNLALGIKTGIETLYVSETDEANGLVKRNGIDYFSEQTVTVTSIDDFVEQNHLKISLIKSDIEGGEAALLEGAKKTIREQSPILLISVYHTADDFFSIKDKILAINDKYNIEFFRPLTASNVITDTMLICQVD